MSKKQKNVKMNKRLLNMGVEKKLITSFKPLKIGYILMLALALANIFIYANLAKVGVFSTPSRAVGMILLIVIALLNLSMMSVVARDLTNSIVEPIKELKNVINELKQGELDIEVKYAGKDELGELGKDLSEACAQIHTVVTDASTFVGEIAEGHFDVSSEVEDKYIGDFEELLVGINKLKGEMNRVLNQIKVSSDQVMVGADQMAGSAQGLAEGATDQSGAIEELSATIQNVANISEQSAQNAVFAAESATNAAEDAKKSREEVNELTEAMARITATSEEIQNIIAAIEDIASQTNLLSLNASIEAARAGEAGRGFAVVADQIGKLAADSAQSAVETKELINKSLVEVEAGNSIVEHTMESFNAVLANMESFAGMASGAAEASKEQAEMLRQIEIGIEQITMVVENNSAAAEETSAVSQELSAQATNLEQMISQFVLVEE